MRKNKVEPIVSIVCNTFNHELYIQDAIEGFLMQKTTFPIEILLHDDASNDKTTNIIKEYEAKYPHLIKPIYQKDNQYLQRTKIGPNFQYPRVKGKYIAICEGDDYWTDPNKLQKQVTFLEANPDFTICCHNAHIINEDGILTDSLKKIKSAKTFFIEDLAVKNFIHTPTVVFRVFKRNLNHSLLLKVPVGDYTIHLLNAKYGKIYYMPDYMATYRKHAGGIWSKRNKYEKSGKWIITICFLLDEFSNNVKVRRRLLNQFIKTYPLVKMGYSKKLISESSFQKILSYKKQYESIYYKIRSLYNKISSKLR